MLRQTLHHAMGSGLRVVLVSDPDLARQLSPLLAERDLLVQPAGVRVLGQALAVGVAATGDAPAWLLMPAEASGLQAHSVLAVAQALAQYQGKRGYPLGVTAELYSELVELQDDEGVRRLLARYPSLAVELADPGVLVTTAADLENAPQRRYRA